MAPHAEIENILNITALSILADKKVYFAEVESFTAAAQKIPSIQNAHPKLSEVWLRGWYERNKVQLVKEMQSKTFADWFRAKLDDVAQSDDKAAIINAMEKVALSDHEFHNREKALINFTARHWNIELR